MSGTAGKNRAVPLADGSEVPPLALDGDVRGGRLFVWADTLALALVGMADRFDGMDPVIVMAAGQTPGAVLRSIGAQLAEASVQYGTEGMYDGGEARD